MRKMVEETHGEALAHRRELESQAAATNSFQEVVFSARTDVDPPIWQVGDVPSDV